ncbi:MAG: hypothetical protein BRD45_02620 [Bacteroidetes bacterium QS_8_64_10]|nr:MAG: hypothetical protein BRD45_02620 [Bacteroidetes bacterium QS_8_64_10]
MLTTVEGVFREGRVERAEAPNEVGEEARVLVTFLPSKAVDLRARGIDETQAATLRTQLAPFAEDWNDPDMAIYDDYDARRRKNISGRRRRAGAHARYRD